MKNKAEGVKGWLMVLVIIIGVVFPLGHFGSALNIFKYEAALRTVYIDNYPLYFILSQTVILAKIVIFFYTAYVLTYRRDQNVKRIAIVCIWVSFVALNIVSLSFLSLSYEATYTYIDLINSMALPFIFAIVATTYLLKSKRVANTYCKVEA